MKTNQQMLALGLSNHCIDILSAVKYRTAGLDHLLTVWILLVIGFLTCPTWVVGQQPEINDDMILDWTIEGPGSDILSGSPYTLVNYRQHESIKYHHRGTFGGVNLGWDKSTNKKNFRLVSRAAGKVPIKYGDRVAISVSGGSYLRYQKRNIGINLVWSKNPIYEWVIAGGTEGEAVKPGTRLALFNTVEKDFMIYAPRGGKAINLRWYVDRNVPGYTGQLARIAKKEGLKYLKSYIGNK